VFNDGGCTMIHHHHYNVGFIQSGIIYCEYAIIQTTKRYCCWLMLFEFVSCWSKRVTPRSVLELSGGFG
jgi:hypothetical protein